MNPSLWSHNCNEQVKSLSSHFLPKEIFAHLKGGYFSNEAATRLFSCPPAITCGY